MEVSSLVQSITSAFQDAAMMVNRIQDQHLKQSPRHGQDRRNSFLALEDLAESLELGPIVIRGYYASDVKRFGHQYLTGDDRARDQLKDVLLNLQMSVLTTLRSVLIGDGKLEYAAIQAAADDCRVDAGVCLGQLSQRLAEPSRVQSAFRGQVSTVPFRLPTPPLKYSGSPISLDSPRTPPTPEMEAALEFDYPGRLPGFNPHSSKLRGKASALLQGPQSPASPRNLYDDPYNTMQPSVAKSIVSVDDTHIRRPSSSCLSSYDQPRFSPVSPPLSNAPWKKVSPVSSDASSMIARPIKKKSVSSEYADPACRIPDNYQQDANQLVRASRRKMPSGSSSIRSTGSTQIRQSSSNLTSKYAQPSPREQIDSRSISSIFTASPSRDNAALHWPLYSPWMSEQSDTAAPFVPPTPPLPIRSVARNVAVKPEPLRDGAKKILGDVDPILDVFHGLLSLPTESNLMGYCKSAQRLQAGSDKKVFALAQRPAGFTCMVPYWRCEKCMFDGPVATSAANNAKCGKPEKIFDPAVREYDGIRFKWIFLAKCHVPTKAVSSAGLKVDGISGSFACIFCTAEGSIRNWSFVDQGAAASVSSSGKSKADSASGVSPVFGNSHSFMEHLQMHRKREYWPNKEMQNRTKCVVGRVASMGEDFEINLMP